MRSALTNRIVLTAEPKDRPYDLRGARVRGLILRVQPSGHKAWIVTWGRGKHRTLWSVEGLPLDQAREQARQAVVVCVQSKLLRPQSPSPPVARSKRC
ncbi:MAG: Arm DNA-binding domain-containing protein [Stenotrophomonas sp.]|nr:Arm DNA-binding domain-containing protein [Stenotrophomonas sp.]